MKTIKYTFALVFALLSFGASAEDTITEEKVLKMIAQMEAAVSARDAQRLASHFVPDAEITLDMPESMGGTITLDLEQYKGLLQQGWGMYEQYSYEVSNVAVSMTEDGLGATVTDTTTETIVVDGQTIKSSAEETIGVISVKGIPMIQSVYGKLLM